MSARIYLLGGGAFAVGTSAYVVSGVLPAVSAELGVTITAAGQLTTVFALAYAVSAPLLATITARWERRRLLLIALLVAALGNALSAVATTYPLLLGGRIVAALGAAAFTPAATLFATALRPPAERGRAVAIVFGGMTVALALGVPDGLHPRWQHRLPRRVRAGRGRQRRHGAGRAVAAAGDGGLTRGAAAGAVRRRGRPPRAHRAGDHRVRRGRDDVRLHLRRPAADRHDRAGGLHHRRAPARLRAGRHRRQCTRRAGNGPVREHSDDLRHDGRLHRDDRDAPGHSDHRRGRGCGLVRVERVHLVVQPAGPVPAAGAVAVRARAVAERLGDLPRHGARGCARRRRDRHRRGAGAARGRRRARSGERSCCCSRCGPARAAPRFLRRPSSPRRPCRSPPRSTGPGPRPAP